MHNTSIGKYDKTRIPDELDDRALCRVEHFRQGDNVEAIQWPTMTCW